MIYPNDPDSPYHGYIAEIEKFIDRNEERGFTDRETELLQKYFDGGWEFIRENRNEFFNLYHIAIEDNYPQDFDFEF